MSNSHSSYGQILGGILLISGCCIGAGMLGLPVQSGFAGFIPSLVTFFICWLFMLLTGLLLLEVNVWFGQGTNIVTLADKTLGKAGKVVAWSVFLFLFYSLMVAYIAAGGAIVSASITAIFSTDSYSNTGEILFCVFFGWILYQGTKTVDWLNRILMLGLIVSYVILVAMGIPHIDLQLLKHQDWSQTTFVIPTVLVSFGFHNLIPSLTTYFQGDVKVLKRILIIGSAIPLVMYLIWEWIILGLVPLQYFTDALGQGEMATQALKEAVGASWISDMAEIFAFFALVTSFLGVSLSFVDFLADGLQVEKTAKGKLLLIVLVIIPALGCAFLYPSIFLVALNLAGGFGTVILFGILPALMVWKGRYQQKIKMLPLVPGGKAVLVLVIAFSIGVMCLQVL